MSLGSLLKEVKSIREKGAFLTPYIVKQLYTRREKRLSQDMWFSPSQLSKMCPRAYAMAWKMDLPLVDEFMPDSRWAMDSGTSAHTLLQSMWGGDGKWILGGWKCSECGHVHGIDEDDKVPIPSHGEVVVDKVTVRSSIVRPDVCELCGMTPSWRRGFIYEEPLLYNLDLRISGLTDGLIIIPGNTMEIWDIKTTRSARWIRNAPNDDHVSQVTWYGDMAGVKKARIVYVDLTEKKLEKAIIEHPFTIDRDRVRKQKEEVRNVREVFQAPKEELEIPACPDDGRGTFGPCECAGLEDAWKSYGDRLVSPAYGNCHPQ